MTIVKYVLFIFNVIFLLAGVGICVIGALLYTNATPALFNIEEFVNELGALKLIFLIVAIVLGATIFFISFLGCCGAIKENLCMLSSYSVILIILAVLKTALIVYFYFKKEDLYAKIPEVLHGINDKFPKKIHLLESKLHCCGIDKDTYYNSTLPPSCCEATPCIESLKNMPCSTIIRAELSNNELMIPVFIGLIIVFEILAAIVSCCLGHKSREESNYKPYER